MEVEQDLLEGETPEERERRLKVTRERLGTKEKKSPDGIKASYFLKHFQGKLPGRKVTVGDMNKESMGEESCKGKKGMKTFKEYFEENLAAESEQLDELSKSTLASYIKKSTDDHPRHQAAADEIGRKADINKPMPEKMHKALDKVWNRKMGIHRAVDKLTRENEQLDEESCKVGDQVHVGHMVKGGAGVEGKVEKIEGNQVFVKNSEGRTFKGLLKNVSKKD